MQQNFKFNEKTYHERYLLTDLYENSKCFEFIYSCYKYLYKPYHINFNHNFIFQK